MLHLQFLLPVGVLGLVHLVHASSTAGIPTVHYDVGDGFFRLPEAPRIVIDEAFARERDEQGQTLIPPSLDEFGHTFAGDLEEVLGLSVEVSLGKSTEYHDIFITLDSPESYLDVAGRETSEGYSITVADDGITVLGASPLGAWWGTRSLLQQLLLHQDRGLPVGSIKDSPGWAKRGVMVS